ncbi:Protein F54E12.2, partial [Aphelenchoides avenae]
VSKNSSSVLAQIVWQRIILDEAHVIKNRNSLASKACCRLVAFNRWCLTGTPIHNELWDLYSLIKFLRVQPFDERTHWKEYIMSSSKHASQRLNTLVKSLLLRRTKDQKDALTDEPIVTLKPRLVEEVKVVMEGLEAEVYHQMKEAVKLRVKTLLEDNYEDVGLSHRRKKKKNVTDEVRNPFKTGARAITGDNFQSMSCILVLLLRLRQAAVHMFLTAQDIDMDAFRNEGLGEADALEQSLANMSLHGNLREALEESFASSDETRMQQIGAVFEPDYLSAKVRAMLERLDEIVKKGEKCVIVSQWSTMLDLIERHVRARGIRLTSITGKVLTKDRQERVDSFNKEGRGAQVMLLSLTAGGVGLNLVGGNHLFLVDLHWNPALEQQACDRIYRMGQTRDVFIHK